MVESARLESVYTLIAYRGFESLRLRQIYFPTISKIFQNYHQTLINTAFELFFYAQNFLNIPKVFYPSQRLCWYICWYIISSIPTKMTIF